MLKFKKRLAAIIFLSLLSAATIVSCGKQGNTEESNTEQAGEQPKDSAEHPTDSTATEHPADSTKSQ